VISQNNLYSGFLIKLTQSIGNPKQAVLESTIAIKDDSENSALLFYQAKCLLQLNFVEQALLSARYACELNPESTSAWVLLAQCYFLNKNYQKALFALDMAPVYLDEPLVDGLEEKLPNDVEITKPKKHNTSDYYCSIMADHKQIDYEPFQDEISEEIHYLNEKQNNDQISILSHLPANQLTSCEKQIYELLSQIEKQIGWAELIKIRNQIFLKTIDNPWDDENENSKEEKKQSPVKFETQAIPAGRKRIESFQRKNKSEENDQDEESNKSDDFSDDDFEENKKKTYENKQNEMKNSNNVGNSEKKSPVSKRKSIENIIEEPIIKRICEKLDNGLACLNDDLYAYYQWEKEETKKIENLSIF